MDNKYERVSVDSCAVKASAGTVIARSESGTYRREVRKAIDSAVLIKRAYRTAPARWLNRAQPAGSRWLWAAAAASSVTAKTSLSIVPPRLPTFLVGKDHTIGAWPSGRSPSRAKRGCSRQPPHGVSSVNLHASGASMRMERAIRSFGTAQDSRNRERTMAARGGSANVR